MVRSINNAKRLNGSKGKSKVSISGLNGIRRKKPYDTSLVIDSLCSENVRSMWAGRFESTHISLSNKLPLVLQRERERNPSPQRSERPRVFIATEGTSAVPIGHWLVRVIPPPTTRPHRMAVLLSKQRWPRRFCLLLVLVLWSGILLVDNVHANDDEDEEDEEHHQEDHGEDREGIYGFSGDELGEDNDNEEVVHDTSGFEHVPRRVPPSGYVNPNAQLIDEDHECRDDAYVDCEEIFEDDKCDLIGDVINYRDLCPVTCGKCALPLRTAVWTDFDCFHHKEDITIFFTNKDPEAEDFIGIYPSYVDFNEDLEQLEEAKLWLYGCGSLEEHCKTAMGGLLFGMLGPSDEADWLEFPLPGGEYKAALARLDPELELLAESVPFTVKAQGQSCYFECNEIVYTDQPCYSPGEDSIYITFESCLPQPGDRVAIYPSTVGAHPGDLDAPLWLGTCGKQKCIEAVHSDNLEFGADGPDAMGTMKWPLPPGDYKAFLMRMNEGDTYGRMLAESNSFVMMPQGETCSGVSEDL
jgi:hypothetical protein